MAKIIKLTPELLADIRKDFEEALMKAKFADGKIDFTKSFTSISRKATVYFTEMAWLKMQSLISEFDKEVAWHGIAYRGDDPAKDEYTITDIMVYPQEVTGSTVTTDQEKYQSWLMSHDDDVFNNIRMQGHSHVNMSTSPSGVDLTLYEKILDQLDDTMFYIFLIYNKRGEKTYKIYDMAKNILFETSDVTVKIVDDGSGLTSFLEDAKSKVQTKTYQYTGAYNGQNGAYGSGSYSYGSGYYGSGSYGTGYKNGSSQYSAGGVPGTTHLAETKKEPEKKPDPPAPAKTEEQSKDSKKNVVSLNASGKKSSGRRKGKRRDKGNKAASHSQQSIRGFGMDDDDDPYGFDEDGFYHSGRFCN